MTVDKIRVSIGSASVLGLDSKEFKEPPTTLYIMTYKEGHCTANCGFCPQARESSSSTDKLARIEWPVYSFKEFLTKLKYATPLKKVYRICVQTLNYPENFKELIEIVTQIRKVSNLPISVATPPLSKDKMSELKLIGVQRIGIALDGATKEIFEKVKGKEVRGPYIWEDHIKTLKDALEIFSKGSVSTHIIIGLGETEKQVIGLLLELIDMGILPGLFAFAPIKGTQFENNSPADLLSFRKIQLSRFLIINKNKRLTDFALNSKEQIVKFNINKLELENIIKDTDAFLTSGCPSCNRPYYDSRPSGPIYSYARKLMSQEKEEIHNLLQNFVN